MSADTWDGSKPVVPIDDFEKAITVMSDRLDQLERHIDGALVKVSGTWTLDVDDWVGTGTSTKDGIVKALEDLKTGPMVKLREGTKAVANGTKTLSWWLDWSNVIASQCNAATQDIGNWSAVSIISNTASKTTGDISDAAKKGITTGFAVSIPLLLGVAIVYLFVLRGGR